ncbi:CPBP family intramembrane glutamic endopeptidase [Clostridium botulinum]|uniref:CPBP family intramembrane glutamic endopeptidase n=1 Tax=Clostridium botulinum TaxID=1491 RepID=UPI0007736085|nr:CPBP family intramembrane glutamic endopeptidase [Clostridium botulinum]
MDWINHLILIVACFIIYPLIFKDSIKIMPNKYTKKDIIVGIFIGFLAMSGIYLLELNLSYIKVGNINYIDNKLISYFGKLVLVALAEELMFRAIMLNGLLRAFKSKYLPVIITSAIFGLMHASNPNATIASVISNGLGGVMYSIAFIESSSIWLPVALHFSWNFFQGPVFGFKVSGLQFSSVVQQSFVGGKDIFTGGAYGPEGGILGISFRILVIVMLLLYYYFSIKKRNDLTQDYNFNN